MVTILNRFVSSEKRRRPGLRLAVALIALAVALLSAAGLTRASDGLGGFTSGAIDVGSLPQYVLPNSGGGSGGGSGDDCPALSAAQSAYLYDSAWDEKMLCLYDLPANAPVASLAAPSISGQPGLTIYRGPKVTLTLTSPSGQSYSHDYLVDKSRQTVMPYGWDPNVIGPSPSFVLPDRPRTPFAVWAHFAAAQEYGDWRYQVCAGDCAQPFASGTLTVGTAQPIYSITPLGVDLNPLILPSQVATIHTVTPGEQLAFRGRGWQPGRTLTLALYSTDPTYQDETTHKQVAFYAAQVTAAADGTFAVDFVAGPDAQAAFFDVLIDPQPGVYNPGPVVLLLAK